MKTLVYLIIALGLFELASNLFHILKGKKELIGLSAKKQHQELSLELGYQHFFVKAIIMLVFGALFTVTGLITLFKGTSISFEITLGLFALYGIAQACYYKRPYKVWLSLLVYILPVIILVLLSAKANGAPKQSTFDQALQGQFVFPFLLSSEPIKRLLVMNFKGDTEYEMIEPQFYDDSVYGKGLRVLLYRTDKKIDVYFQPGVFFDSKAFTVGKGLGYFAETKMLPARFEIKETGVDIDIAFTDYKGRNVSLRINENSCNAKPFPFLAPVGNDVQKPSKLFLVYMPEFDFIKKAGTEIHAFIGDRKLIPETFPMKRNGKKVYFTRYASKLTIGELNSTAYSTLVFEPIVGNITYGNHHFTINENQKVSKYWIYNGTDEIAISFHTGFPNLQTLPQNSQVIGTWDYQVSGNELTGGTYTVVRKGDSVEIEIDVTKKWEPNDLPLSFKVFTFFVHSFRTWPTTYKWQGTVNLVNGSLRGAWQRKK